MICKGRKLLKLLCIFKNLYKIFWNILEIVQTPYPKFYISDLQALLHDFV